MKSAISQFHLLNTKVNRDILRQKGQFWTPEWVAKAMVNYVIEDSNLVFDPAFGKGAFYLALDDIITKSQTRVNFYGIDIDSQLVQEAKEHFSKSLESCKVELRDFIKNPPNQLFKSIVANPPYIRHHRLSEQVKMLTKNISINALGKTIDGRAGIHVFFLIQSLKLLELNGKLAFIMPSDTCEGIFAQPLWHWITQNYCLECVATFSPDATPFPNVDTNPIIFFIRNAPPKKRFVWLNVIQPLTEDLSIFVSSKFKLNNFPSLKIVERDLSEALSTGLSRDPEYSTTSKYSLLDFATVMRGIATGANEFFFLTRDKAVDIKIPKELLIPAIGRTRDVIGFYLTTDSISELDRKGRPTLLFAPDSRKIEDFSPEVQRYLKQGEQKGLPNRALISSRKPWYKMEQRSIPPFLFAYLGRRNARFIRNLAEVAPLTGFLCVYPRSDNPDYVDKLWNILKHPDTLKNLNQIGKSYGSGAIKIEPRALEKLPLPEFLVHQYGMDNSRVGQIPTTLEELGNTI
jgi:adenine-specific DNA-methyltransferase